MVNFVYRVAQNWPSHHFAHEHFGFEHLTESDRISARSAVDCCLGYAHRSPGAGSWPPTAVDRNHYGCWYSLLMLLYVPNQHFFGWPEGRWLDQLDLLEYDLSGGAEQKEEAASAGY